MKHRKIFVFMLMIEAMTTVYAQERYRAKPIPTKLYSDSSRWKGNSIRDGMVKKHWPYI